MTLGLGLLLATALARSPRVEPLPTVSEDLAAPLPIDDRVRSGTLPNGLTWYVEPNDKPAGRVELRLVVKAGSLLEDEDQLGIAHFVEHMAFNGTDHFAGNELIAYLESLGAQFGAHLNAYTSFDETVYQLQIPVDKPGLVDMGLLVLADFAGGLTFDEAECEKERGVVLEEWRLGQGLGRRAQDATLPVMFHGSRYLHRLPIGTEASLTNLTCASARRFWKDWYRPDLMAVAVVGDIDPAKVEAGIRLRFEGLKGPEAPRPRTTFTVPGHEAPMAVVFTDPELPQGLVTLGSKVDEIERPDHGAYRHFLLEQMLFMMFNERLAVLTLDPEAPFFAAEAGESGLGHQRAMHTLSAAPKEGQALASLKLLAAELARVRRYGFTEAELGRARDAMARNLQAYYDERFKTESAEHVEEILRVFLTDEPMPGIPYEFALSKAYLPTITLAEVDALVRDGFFPETGRVVQALLPERGVPPTEAELLATVAEGLAMELEAPAEEAAGGALLTTLPPEGTARRIARDRKLGTTTWRLQNGVTVVLKPTTFQEDAVVLEAFSPGGTSLVADADYVPAITASSIALRSGLGDHDVVALSRLSAGSTAGVAPGIGRTREVLSGGSAATEVERLLQLVHLQFTAPRFDATAFRLEQEGRREQLEHRHTNPDSVFEDRWNDLVWDHHPRMSVWTQEDVDAMSLERSREIFRQRFANAADFTFVLVGTLDEAKVVPLLARYLGSLPASPDREVWKDDGARRVTGVHTFEHARGDTPRGRVRILFHGDFESTPMRRMVLEATASSLETLLMDELREELGGTYGVSVSQGTQEQPVGTYQVRIEFECDPERLDELEAAAWRIIGELREEPVSDGMLSTMREKNKRWYETVMRENDMWASSLAGMMGNGENPRDLLRYLELNERLTPEAVQGMAREVLDTAQYIEAIVRP